MVESHVPIIGGLETDFRADVADFNTLEGYVCLHIAHLHDKSLHTVILPQGN
jgi:hypothetical protein